MTWVAATLIVGSCLLVSATVTYAVRRYALARSILDVPNDRSSHLTPTPRGGGIGLVLPILAYIVLAGAAGWLSARVAVALVGGAAAIAGIGWIDDRRSTSAGVRFAVHLAAAGWTVAWLGGLPTLELGRWTAEIGLVGAVLAVILLVAATNIYNFMDGLDGIAGVEGATTSASAGLLLLVAGAPGLASVSAAILGACAGFLAWNWEPARIFMGDVGSGTLGFLFAGLALASEHAGAVPLLTWALLLAVFLVDGSITLVRRALRGERVHQAHREHAYQRLARSGLSHAAVSSLVLIINLFLALIAWWGLRTGMPLTATMIGMALVIAGYLAVERILPHGSSS